ncbi:hypothetical protein QYF61_002060 [Mycteria americana]|uniref:Uncharacterized protein n=1 Tax=Mycteria americana TaxID=33587 RepID=A0AAN7S372_MYCAM|nr:hypothetical protein QYF61_002060 [Mycteria americana]
MVMVVLIMEEAEQAQLSQPVPVGEVLQPSDHFCGPPLDLLQQLHVPLVLRAPELDAVLQVRSHQSRVEGQNHLPRPAGHTSFDAAQDTVGLLGCERTLLAHVQLFVHQYPQVLFRRAALDHIIPQPVLEPRIAPTQAKQPQLPQPLLIRLLLQTLHQLCCPSLDTLQHLNVSLVLRGPKLSTVFKVRPHQYRVQGHDHFPTPAGHTISDTSQDAVGLFGHLGRQLAHIQLAGNQHPQIPTTLIYFFIYCPVLLNSVVNLMTDDLLKRNTGLFEGIISSEQSPWQHVPGEAEGVWPISRKRQGREHDEKGGCLRGLRPLWLGLASPGETEAWLGCPRQLVVRR